MSATINYLFSHGYIRKLVWQQADIFFEYVEAGPENFTKSLQQAWRLAAKDIKPDSYDTGGNFSQYGVSFIINIRDPYEIMEKELTGTGNELHYKEKNTILLLIEIQQTEKLQRTDCLRLCIAAKPAIKKIIGYYTCEYGRENGQPLLVFCSWSEMQHSNYGSIPVTLPDCHEYSTDRFLTDVSKLIVAHL